MKLNAAFLGVALALPGAQAICTPDKCYRATETVTTAGPPATTEVQVVTQTETITASTETIEGQTTITVGSTLTVTGTTTVTTTVQPAMSSFAVVRRVQTLVVPSFPEYATAACQSFDRYKSACSRAGVVPTVITEPAPPKTVTVTETATTLASTTTVVVPVTETTLATNVVTQVSIEATVTTTATVTATVTAAPDPNIVANGDFEKATMDGWRVQLGPDVAAVSLGPGQRVLALRKLANLSYSGVQTTVVGVAGTTYSCSFRRAWKTYLTEGVFPRGIVAPQGRVIVNNTNKVGIIMRPNEAGVFKTETFTFVSTGSDTITFQAASPQADTVALNEFYLDDVACIAVQ